MKKICAAVMLILLQAGLSSQGQPGPIAKGPALKLQIVFGRYDKEKSVSSLPYSLSLIAAPGGTGFPFVGRVRVGLQVPMRMETTGPPNNAPIPGNVIYKDVGNMMDCRAEPREDGKFSVRCSFEQSSIALAAAGGTSAGARPAGSVVPPLIRSFRSEADLILGDGETAQHSMGTDPLTGETLRIDVTLNVVK